MPKLYVIGGCNGAGKTTASFTMLPEILDCAEYVNSDEIARGLSPFDPSLASIKATKVMLERIQELLERKVTFGVETTLSTKTLAKILVHAKELGYTINLVFFWLSMPELAIERVALRVKSGGHDIPTDTILRRYGNGIDNLFNVYMSIVDYWIIIDNSGKCGTLVAEGGVKVVTKIHNKVTFKKILEYERTRDERD